MLAAQRVTEEVLGTCRQEALLALRRSVLPGMPIRSSRKLELRKAFQEHRATATVGELRAMVGHAVGVPLDGKYRLRFDRALINLTSAPLKKHRPKRRFTIARGSRTESA